MNFNKEDIDKRYREVRNAINYKYPLIDIIKNYNSSATVYMRKIPSILTDMDSTPSFYVDYEKRVWKCFSTGKGGGYLELLYWTKKLVEHEDVNITSLANKILISDVDMQKELKIKSIYKSQNTGEINITLRNTKPRQIQLVNFDSILKELGQRKNKDLLLDFISDFQGGVNLKDLVNNYSVYGENLGKSNDNKKELEDLISQLFK